jgi:hypothetical protein
MKNSGQLTKERSGVGIKTLVFFVLIVVALQVIAAYLEIILIDNWEKRSQFGEMFGSINTLFSGLAFAGVIYTILLQRKELESQRESQAKSEQLMVLTAQLSALNSLVEATSRKLIDMKERKDPATEIASVKTELDDYLGQTKSILNKWAGLKQA